MADPDLLVVCLCAQWCGVCRDYGAIFQRVAAQFPLARFVWMDIEDQADLVDAIDVETFPTVLIAAGHRPVFFGSLAPQAGTLERIVRDRAAQADTLPESSVALQQLVRQLRDRP